MMTFVKEDRTRSILTSTLIYLALFGIFFSRDLTKYLYNLDFFGLDFVSFAPFLIMIIAFALAYRKPIKLEVNQVSIVDDKSNQIISKNDIQTISYETFSQYRRHGGKAVYDRLCFILKNGKKLSFSSPELLRPGLSIFLSSLSKYNYPAIQGYDKFTSNTQEKIYQTSEGFRKANVFISSLLKIVFILAITLAITLGALIKLY